MKQFLFVLIFVFSPVLLQAQKPILPDFHADPSIHFWDGKYWIYPSTDEPGSTSDSPYGPFEYRGIILDNDSRNSHHSIIEIEDQWYLFYHIEGPSPYERRVCADYLYYHEDGSIREVKMTSQGIRPLK